MHIESNAITGDSFNMSLKDQFPGQGDSVEVLSSHLKSQSNTPVVLTGTTASGKTFLLSTLCQSLGIPNLHWFECDTMCCASPRQFYDAVLRRLDPTIEKRAISTSDFLILLPKPSVLTTLVSLFSLSKQFMPSLDHREC